MQGRRIAAHWQVAAITAVVIALAAIALLVSNTGDGSGLPHGFAAQREQQRVSQALAAARQKAADASAATAASPTPEATPTRPEARQAGGGGS
jgi:hypothetical protein